MRLFFFPCSRNKSWASVHSVNHIIFHSWSFQAIIIIIRTFLLPESSKHPPKLYLHVMCNWKIGGQCVYWAMTGRRELGGGVSCPRPNETKASNRVIVVSRLSRPPSGSEKPQQTQYLGTWLLRERG